MALSPFSGMKMRTLLLVAALGLLAVAHSTPVDFLAVTQIPTNTEDSVTQEDIPDFLPVASSPKKPEDEIITDVFLTSVSTPKTPEDEVIREVITDGFLVISTTSQSHKRNTASQTSQQPSSDSKESGLVEGNPNPEGDPNDKVTTHTFHQEGEINPTTSAPQAQSSTPSMDTFDSSVESTTVQSRQSDFTSLPVINEDWETTTSNVLVSQTTDPNVSSGDNLGSDLVYDEGKELDQTTTASPTSPAALSTLMSESEGSGFEDISTIETSAAVWTSTAALSTLMSEREGSGFEDISTIETSAAVWTSTAALSTFMNEMSTESEGSGFEDISTTETSAAVSTSAPAPSISEDIYSGDSSTVETSSMDAATDISTISISTAASASTVAFSTSMKTMIVGRERSWLKDSSAVEDSTAAPTSTAALSTFIKTSSRTEQNTAVKSEIYADLSNQQNDYHKGHSTPGWIIILAFIVGVGALVMVCVAIATRDKWNAPNQASQPETQTNSTNQQRELEMETFLEKERPRENGKAAEYTVIPLEEFPDNYS